jgi:CO/xanthine dehydrogenase FAD-binding subunit
MLMPEYLRPSTLEEALAALGRQRMAVLAGGTDFYPARVGAPVTEVVLDITGVEGLRAIEAREDHWRIPALATWTDLVRADLPPWFDGLKRAAREVGGLQIQNAGTLCGNLCNASPAADGIPPLLSLGAEVELASDTERTIMSLAEFVSGNRETVLAPDQLMIAIRIPKPTQVRARGHFNKLGARRYLVISIVMVAAAIEVDSDRRIARAAVVVGACSPVARRLPLLENALAGQVCDERLGSKVQTAHLADLTPLDDVRGSADYRIDAALTLTERTLSELGAAV